MIALDSGALSILRERVRPYLTEQRYRHTLEVEEEAARIGALYLPDKVGRLRVAALLHDITKAYTLEKQLQTCEEFGIILHKSDLSSPQVLHAVTGAAVAGRDFPEYTDEEILGGIRWHTTGRDGMTVFESVVYLADYIEPSRTYEDCTALRRYFWDEAADAEDRTALAAHLCRTMILSIDMTLRSLMTEGRAIGTDTVLARNCFLDRLEALGVQAGADPNAKPV